MEVYFAVDEKMLKQVHATNPYPLNSKTFLYGSLAMTRGQSLDAAMAEVKENNASPPAGIVHAHITEKDLLDGCTSSLFYEPTEKIMVKVMGFLTFKDE